MRIAAIGVADDIGDSSVDRQCYVAFVIEIVQPRGSSIGANLTWSEITLDSDDEPITTGLVRKLPWLLAYYSGMLDGARYRDKSTLANTSGAADFEQSGDLKGIK
jgi:hypothetical protein